MIIIERGRDAGKVSKIDWIPQRSIEMHLILFLCILESV